jgi:hypothetical protein
MTTIETIRSQQDDAVRRIAACAHLEHESESANVRMAARDAARFEESLLRALDIQRKDAERDAAELAFTDAYDARESFRRDYAGCWPTR